MSVLAPVLDGTISAKDEDEEVEEEELCVRDPVCDDEDDEDSDDEDSDNGEGGKVEEEVKVECW